MICGSGAQEPGGVEPPNTKLSTERRGEEGGGGGRREEEGGGGGEEGGGGGGEEEGVVRLKPSQPPKREAAHPLVSEEEPRRSVRQRWGRGDLVGPRHSSNVLGSQNQQRAQHEPHLHHQPQDSDHRPVVEPPEHREKRMETFRGEETEVSAVSGPNIREQIQLGTSFPKTNADYFHPNFLRNEEEEEENEEVEEEEEEKGEEEEEEEEEERMKEEPHRTGGLCVILLHMYYSLGQVLLLHNGWLND
ncbi:unnamed protein product [Arctogadus glacialis]